MGQISCQFVQIFINSETMSNNGLIIENMDLSLIYLAVYIKLCSEALHGKALYGRALHIGELPTEEVHGGALSGSALYDKAPQGVDLRGGELQGRELQGEEFRGGALHSKHSWAELSMADLIVSQEKFETFQNFIYLLFISC